MSKTIKILLSQHGLPDTKNGSWTQRIQYFLESSHNVFDYVICGPTTAEQKINTFKTTYCKVVSNKYVLKLFPNIKFKHFIKALKQIIDQHNDVVICVMDNVRLNNELSTLIDQYHLQSKVKVIFYNCGFSYFLSNREHIKFCKNIDEIIFLTKSAYDYNKAKYSEFIPQVSILHNPVDKSQFKLISDDIKSNLLQTHNLDGKTVFLWLSHNRPKKGLHIILDAWRIWAKDKSDVALLVVGVESDKIIKNVKFLGKIPSNEVHEFYKIAHVYLFPTLWKEGFGLSLAQAICSGCYCIAAANGGVEEYMSNRDGELIEQPNFIKEWVASIEKAQSAISNGWKNETAGSQILSIEEWSKEFANVFVNDSNTN